MRGQLQIVETVQGLLNFTLVYIKGQLHSPRRVGTLVLKANHQSCLYYKKCYKTKQKKIFYMKCKFIQEKTALSVFFFLLFIFTSITSTCCCLTTHCCHFLPKNQETNQSRNCKCIILISSELCFSLPKLASI